MNLPNKLTVGRIFLTPVFFIVFALTVLKGNLSIPWIIVLWIIQIVIEISDVLDGHIARSRNLVSDIGKILDPFSDVLSRVTYFICFTAVGLMPLWAMIVIVWREFCIMFIRMVIAKEGTALAAKGGGKAKAVFYFISGVFALIILTFQSLGIDLYRNEMLLTGRILFSLAAVSSVISFIQYFILFMRTDTMKQFVKE